MRSRPRLDYGSTMQTEPSPEVLSRPVDLPRVTCKTCEHTEFAHGDLKPRMCLHFECECSSFARHVPLV